MEHKPAKPTLKVHLDPNTAIEHKAPAPVSWPFRSRNPVGEKPTNREIFEALIEWELSCGPVDRWRRQRLIQYAAQLGLSAERAGAYIAQIRERLSDRVVAED